MASSKRTTGEPSSEVLHSPLVAHVVLWYTRSRAVTTGPNTRVEVAVLGRLDMFPQTREPQSCFAGAPTSVWHRSHPSHFLSQCFPETRRQSDSRKPPVCRIPKRGAMAQEVQETLRDQDSLRKWTVSQPAVGGPDIRMDRQVTPRVRGLPATVPLSEYLLVYILTLTNTSNTSEALCV
jgi:hypothetical protein